MSVLARRSLAALLPPSPWVEWAALLTPTLAIGAVIARLGAGRPDPGPGRRPHPPG